MSYEEMWQELLETLERKIHELRLLANNESKSKAERERIQTKIGGLMIALEDMYRLTKLKS